MDHAAVEDRLAVCESAAEAGAAVAREAFRGEFVVESKASPMDSVSDVDRAVQRAVVEAVRESSDAPVVGEEDVAGVETLTSLPASGPAWIVDPIDGTNNFVAGNRNWGVAVACVADAKAVHDPASVPASHGGSASADDGAADDDAVRRPVVAVNEFPVLGDRYVVGDGVTRTGEPASVSAVSDPERFTVNPIFGLGDPDRARLPAVVETTMRECGDLRRVGCAQLALSAVAAGEFEAAVSTVPLHPWDVVGGVAMVRAAGGRATTLAGEPWTPDATSLVVSNDEAHGELLAAFGE